MRPALAAVRIAGFQRLAADADFRRKSILQHRDRRVGDLALVMQLCELFESAADHGCEQVGCNGLAAKQRRVLFVCRRELAVELLDLPLRVVDLLAQLLLVALLEGRRDLSVDLINSLVEGTELLFGVLKVGVELFAVCCPALRGA